MPTGHVIAFPASMDLSAVTQATQNIWEQTKQGVGALAESFGLPGTMQQVREANKNLPIQLAHPLDTMKQVARQTAASLLQPSDPTLIDKAKKAWDSGNRVDAARHFANFLIPFVGAGSDKAGDELQRGDYGKAVGHTAAAVLPFLFGNSETAPVTSEADIANAAARQFRPSPKSATTARPSVITEAATEPITAEPKAEPQDVLASDVDRAAADHVQRTEAKAATGPAQGAQDPFSNLHFDQDSQQQARTELGADAAPQAVVQRAQEIKQKLMSQPSGSQSPVRAKTKTPKVPAMPADIPENAPDVPTFYSKAARTVDEKVPANASGDQILGTLRNNGVKENEIEWMGLEDYLKGKPKVSKDDLQNFIKNNQIQLKETNYGTPEQRQMQELSRQRQAVYSENNKIWSDHLRYADGSTDVFNAMKQGSDTGVQDAISKMAPDKQGSARRFVETDNQIRALDDQIEKVQQTIDASGAKAPRYANYVLDGSKDNYTEKLLTLPQRQEITKPVFDVKRSSNGHDWHVVNDLGGEVLTAGTREYAEQRAAELNTQGLPEHLRGRDGSTFQSSHFDEPNVLAHTRYDDRTSADGKKTLFLEELQSDWHQKGKHEGYNNPAPAKLPDGIYVVPEQGQFQIVNREGNPILSRLYPSHDAGMQAALTHYGEGAGNPGVPNAPFKSDWHELVLKRMLREAAEKGYDQLAWTTGDQQAARYDLSKQINEVSYDPEEQELYARDHDGKEVIHETGVAPEEVENYIGKEPAQKLLKKAQDWKSSYNTDEWAVESLNEGYTVRDPNGDMWLERDGKPMTFNSQTDANKFIEGMAAQDKRAEGVPKLQGLDLKIGGDWAKALYDRAIPNFLNKYAKKWGAKVGTTEIHTTQPDALRYEIVDPTGEVYDAFRNQEAADDAVRSYQQSHYGPGKWTVRDRGTTEKVHSIEITPAMRKSVMKSGQPIAKNENNKPAWVAAVANLAA
jgi:hypothetical protein